MEVILKTVDLTKRFGALAAVDRVSLEVAKGQITGLIGPNGSGKSTLFNTIYGIYKPDEGNIFFKDKKINGLTPDQIYAMGLVKDFQTARLFFGMTVLENMALPPKGQIGENIRWAPLHSKWYDQEKINAKTILELSKTFQIQPVIKNASTEISGGQMKLLQLGRTLMSTPELVLLDEPTAGVNPKLSQEIFELIDMLRKEKGLSFFIIEHKLDLLFDFVDMVYVMHQGEIIAKGLPDEILNNRACVAAYLGDYKCPS